jgi:hypothetical protein
MAVAANVCSKTQCPAELSTTHFLARRGIERVNEPTTALTLIRIKTAWEHPPTSVVLLLVVRRARICLTKTLTEIFAHGRCAIRAKGPIETQLVLE